MTWLRLSFKGWQQRPLRTSVTTAGVAIAVGALFSLLSFLRGYGHGVRREVDRLGAHVLIAPKGCPYDAASIALHGASWPCYLAAGYVQDVRLTPGVDAAAPVFMTASRDPHAGQLVLVGIDTNYLTLRPAWRIAGDFPRGTSDLLPGAEAARRLGWHRGQHVTLPGPGQFSAVVSGILEPTHGPEDTFIFLGLPTAQRWFRHPDQITHLLVRLKDPNQLDRVVSLLRGCEAGLTMNVIPLAPLLRTIQGLVNSTRVLLGCVAVLAWLAAGAGVSNTLLMAVSERTREIGVMRAVGAARAHVFWLFCLETLQVCLVGAVVGVLAAFAGSHRLDGWLRAQLPFAPAGSLIQWDWSIAFACLACALVLGSAAAFLPAWRAAAVSPAEAFRAHARLL
jgi:putative ABC transport system permease protein